MSSSLRTYVSFDHAVGDVLRRQDADEFPVSLKRKPPVATIGALPSEAPSLCVGCRFSSLGVVVS